jgi:N-carbamoylputrescine amidase
MLKVTICQTNDQLLEREWESLRGHVQSAQSDLVLLPEMPFCPWFGAEARYDATTWNGAVAAHERWLPELAKFGPALVFSSRPVNDGANRFNEGFLWRGNGGYQAIHRKFYLPDEDGVFEARWYQRGPGDFTSVSCAGTRIGFLICSEIWALDEARRYGQGGAQVLLTPRLTEHATIDKWLVAGRAAAICAGAYSLSSNHGTPRDSAVGRAGAGWIIDPDGEVLARTTPEEPVITVAIDLERAVRARQTYPRYMFASR